MSVVKPVPVIPYFIRDKCVDDDMVIVNGPYSLDEVLVPETLRDFYERWLDNAGIQQGQTRPTLANWCSNIRELDPKYHIYVTKFIYDKVYHHKTLLKIADKAGDDVSSITIPLVHVRKDFFEANYYQQTTPAIYNSIIQRDFADKYDWHEVAQFMNITFSLPTWSELYDDDEFGEFVESKQRHNMTQTQSETIATATATPSPKDITVQVEECDGVTIRTTTTRVGDNVVRRHTRFEEKETGVDDDDVAEPISPVCPHADDDSNADWDETAFMEIEDPDATDEVVPEDEDTQTLLDDLKYWEIKEETDTSLLVYPVYIMSVFRGRYGYIERVIPTGSLYKRPLYLSEKDGGFWINKTSELSKLIMKVHEENMESDDEDEDESDNDVEDVKIVDATPVPAPAPKFADDIQNWRVTYIIKRTQDKWVATIRPTETSAFAHCPAVVDTDGLYHRNIYYSPKNNGYFISTNCNLYATLLRICKTQTDNTNSYRTQFADDVKKNWIVVKTFSKSALVRPCDTSVYKHRPKKIETEGVYYRPIYYVGNTKDGYFINKDSALFRMISKK